MSYQKPKHRPGMVCYSCRWDRDGRLREALYRPLERPVPDEASAKPARGALAVERQGTLI